MSYFVSFVRNSRSTAPQKQFDMEADGVAAERGMTVLGGEQFLGREEAQNLSIRGSVASAGSSVLGWK